MTGPGRPQAPLDGVRVVEVAGWMAAPGAGAMLADLVAHVVKVEPLRDGPVRGVFFQPELPPGVAPFDPPFQVDDRGKRGLAVALDRVEGQELVRRLVDGSDVFLDIVAADPHLRAVGAFPEVQHPTAGTFRTLAIPMRLRGADVGPRGPAPELGQHTREVLLGLGLSEADVDAAVADGLVVDAAVADGLVADGLVADGC